MLWYLLLFGIILGLVNNRKVNALFVIVMSLQLIIINGLKHVNVGTDTQRYLKRFMAISEEEKIDFRNPEVGYDLLQKLLISININFNQFLLLISIFIYVLLGYMIYKYSRNLLISYLAFYGLGFLTFTFTGIRQSIAVLLVLFSYKYIIERNFKIYIILTLLATLVHSSAIIAVPMYYIAHIKWSRFKVLFLAIIMSLSYLLRYRIGGYLTVLYYDDTASGILEKYQVSEGIGGTALLIGLILLMGLIIYNPFKYQESENVALFNIVLFSFILQIFSSFSYLFTRLNMYYYIFLILYLPYIYSKIGQGFIKMRPVEKVIIKTIAGILITVLLIVQYLTLVEVNEGGVHPYKFWWE